MMTENSITKQAIFIGKEMRMIWMGIEVACKKERVWPTVHETSFHRRVLDALILAVGTLSYNDRCKVSHLVTKQQRTVFVVTHFHYDDWR